ncbi:DUF1800 domain-containing protein [Methylobacterium sp. Leaf117]|uniref:DUF1800 domain-containing protein n=1 Tax=Methylobacterium sp. Leaf117 TaxID=1736260 RepID=UPI0006F685CE|nr:DUF1800 domain-containing protein [Methylobacterium sp. Leaf117]KQP96225.1 hypothetical protein ASF57_00170 [Methylobacterium sp. Leaf117]
MLRLCDAAIVRTALIWAILTCGPVFATPDGSPSSDLALLDALTWGATPTSFSALRAQGREAWLSAQLRPSHAMALPPVAQAQIHSIQPQGALIDRVVAFDAQAKAANGLADLNAKKAAQSAYQGALNDAYRQSLTATILRALYAPDQVRERMTWFWFNRFNVHQGKANLRVLVGDYLDTAIRPHALGRFRHLLTATLEHPAMLRYLDNVENAAGRLNENYARELMELHTLGVGGGYAQHDVEELARILTGAGIDSRPENPRVKPELQGDLVRKGLFLFNPARHDYGSKVLLGHTIHSRGYAEIEEALDVLARHPATARNVSRAMALYLMGRSPSNALVDRLAAVFTRTDGDTAAVLGALVHSPEFVDAAGSGFKDPVRYVFSALRLAYDDRVILNTTPVQNWLNRLGEGLFNRSTPDGYPLDAAAWSGPGQLTTRFEIARQIGSGSAGLFKSGALDAVEEPAFPLLQNGLYFGPLMATLTPRTRDALRRAVSPQDWNTLFLPSPEFMH